MNKQLFSFRTAIIAVFVLVLASCSKTNKEGRLIPANASYVMHLNGSQLSSKLSWDEVKSSEFFKQIAADTTIPPYVMEALNNPDKSGIDIKKDLLVYFVMDKQGAYIGFTGSVTDAEKFGKFNDEVIEGGTEKKDGGITYVTARPLYLGYDKEKFVYIINTPFFHRYWSVKDKDKNNDSWDMDQIIVDIFKMSSDKSLSSNSKFTKLLSDNADAHVWYNVENLAKGSGITEIMPLIDLEKFTNGLASATSINFNNGNVSMKTRLYTGKALSDVFNKYEGGKINEAMVNKLPANGINAALAINFKPEVIRELIKLTGMDGLANSELKREAGISLDDFIKANKGDLLIAISNLRSKKDSFTLDMGTRPKRTIYNNRPEMDYIFAASVNNKEAFGKLIDAAKDKAKEFDGEDSAQANLPAYNFNDQYFVLGKSKTIVDSYSSSNGNNDALLKKIGSGPIGGYADIQSVLKATEPEANADSTDKVIHALSLQMWDNATLKGGQVEDGALVFDIEINLLDKNTNSLKQLSNYFQKLASLSREQKRKEREAYLSETPTPMPREFVAPKSKK